MKKATIILCILLSMSLQDIFAQQDNDTVIYLLTCGPGIETYSVYGHSAIRIVYAGQKRDWVYNWGVFDFNTPNFAWKFANGNLEYMLAVEPMQGFMKEYFFEKRSVICQKLNLTTAEKAALVGLINENLKPENVKYRYDFFFDNCSTRIRDLIEKAVGKNMLYLPDPGTKNPSFRSMVAKYQTTKPWLKFGIDMLLGAPVDKGASYRDRMFLPLDLQRELSETVVNREGKMVPLLQNPEQLLEADLPVIKTLFLFLPAFVFTMLFIIVMILSAKWKNKKYVNWMDIALFSIFSILALLMIFFNVFSLHPQLRTNLNMIWLSPIVPVCLIMMLLKREAIFWFRLLFYVLAGFLVIHLVLPQSFNIANLPLILILLIRSSAHSDFEWNPL
jgi:hypothetical protein